MLKPCRILYNKHRKNKSRERWLWYMIGSCCVYWDKCKIFFFFFSYFVCHFKDVLDIKVPYLLRFYVAWHTISTQAVSSFLNLYLKTSWVMSINFQDWIGKTPLEFFYFFSRLLKNFLLLFLLIWNLPVTLFRCFIWKLSYSGDCIGCLHWWNCTAADYSVHLCI